MAIPPSLQKLPSAGALWILVNMHTSLLSHHNIAVKSALVLTRISPLFIFVVFGLRSCGMPFCLVWRCHNSKSVSSPSHQIIQGKKRNCRCIICAYFHLPSSSVLSLSHGLLSHAMPRAVCPSPSIFSCHTCIQSSHKVWKFWCRNAAFFWYVLFENRPSLEGNNNFVNFQIFGRVVKFGKYGIYNFKQVSYLPQSNFSSVLSGSFLLSVKCK